MAGDLQATIEISVELSTFHNVDLFQRGYYQVRCSLKPPEKSVSSIDVEYRRNSGDYQPDDCLYPALVTPTGLAAVSKTFQILYKNEDIVLCDHFVFMLNMLVDSNKVTEQVDQADIQLLMELFFSDSEIGPESPDCLVSVSTQVLKLHLSCIKGLHHHVPVLFDYFHFAVVDTTVHAVLVKLSLPDPSILKMPKSSWFSKTPANSRVSTPLFYTKLFGNKPISNVLTTRTPLEERQIRFAYDTHRALCSTLLSAQVNLLAYFECLSEFLPQSQQIQIGSLDFGERLDGLIMTIESVENANEVFSQICSDLDNISMEVSLVWSQFLESFTLNKQILPHFRDEHHRQRVGHFSEAFFVQEFTWDELQIHQEQSFQLHQSLGQSIKNSRYYQAIPYIAVECPGLDGDNSSIPIIFEDKYRFCTPDQEEASGKSDLDEIDFAFDDDCCDNKNVVDDELVIIDTDISDIPASQDDPNSSFALGGMLCNGRGPFRETMILDDDLENENSDLCKALDEIQHLEDPLNSIDLKSALRDDPDSRHDIAGNNSPEYQERCLVGHGVAPCHNVNGVVEDNTCSVDETSSFSENKKEDNATLMDVPSQETLSTQDEREKSEQNTSGEKCDELEKDNLKNTCNISDQFANSSGIENSGINKIEENVKDTQEMQTESNENTIKETNDKKDCSTSESSTLDSSHQEASSVVEVEPHGQHETSTDSMSKKEPLSPSDRVMSDDTVSSINNKEPGNNLLVPCKGSESISTSNIVASDPPSSNISTCNKEPDEQVNSSVLCRSSNVVTSRDNVSPKSNNKDHGDTNLVSSDFLEDNKASKDETSVAVVDTNLVSSDVLEDNKARQDETSVVDTNLVSSDVLEDNKARQDETSVVDTNLVSGDVLEDNKASQDKTPVVDTNLVSSDVLEDNKASQDKTSVLDTNLVSSDVQVDNKARQDETPVSDDVNNLLQSSNVVTFSSCREGLDTASMDSILSDSKSDSSVYETPVSSEATGSPSNSQPEVSSNTDGSKQQQQQQQGNKKGKKKPQPKGHTITGCLPVYCTGNTSPSFSRINSTYGGSIKSRFELAKRFVKRQLKFNWKIYSDIGVNAERDAYFSKDRPDSIETHLIICVHGLDGNSGDLRLFRCYLEMALPSTRIDFLMSEVNQGDSFVSFEELTERLVQEIHHYIDAYSIFPSKISFVGHSLGNIIIRSALTHPEMRPLLDRMHTLLSLSGPHVGMLYPTSPLVSTGLWLMQKWKKSEALTELSLHDHDNLRQTYLYRLSQSKGLEYFKNVLLVSSVQDHYVPYHSARIEMCKAAAKDTSEYGTVYREMISNLLSPLKDKQDMNVVRYSCFHALTSSANSFIGRAAHIAMLDSELFIEKLLLVSALDYFR